MTQSENSLEVFTSPESLEIAIQVLRTNGEKIGFIPTMGALHAGHLALVQAAIDRGETPVVSIFVNPKQFNNLEDLAKYPRTLDNDCKLLEQKGVRLVFAPSIDEIYPINYVPLKLDLGILDKVLEGEFRPGHFDGVVAVVNRLFELVKPTSAYFGRKDFQQVAVIKHLAKMTNTTIKIVVCETLREQSGLAMSSRNARLTEKEKKDAAMIYFALKLAKDEASRRSPSSVLEILLLVFKAYSFRDDLDVRLEYVSIIDPVTLNELTEEWVSGATCCVAAFVGNVRLIDNVELVA
jgi:pantoate--beta-alanine ligase